MTKKNKKYKGFLFAELIVALSLLAIFLSCLAVTLSVFHRFNQYQLIRQRCTSAAQAELDNIAVTGAAISAEDCYRLWPGIEVLIDRTEGIEQWKGLKLLKVTASARSYNKEIRIQLNRYISIPEK